MRSWNNIPVVMMRLQDLYQTCPVVDDAFFKRLHDDILANGMQNPIIIVQTTASVLRNKFASVPASTICMPPDNLADNHPLNAIWGGCNRYVVASLIGLDPVPCVISPDFKTAYQLQNIQRSSFPALHQG